MLRSDIWRHGRAACRLRFALRELRGGLRGFRRVHRLHRARRDGDRRRRLVRASLTDGLAREGRVILGGDLAFSLIQREARDAGARLPRLLTAHVSAAATLRAMARTADGRQALVETQGGRWRLSAVRRGRARSDSCRSPTRWPQRDGAFGAAVDPALLARLDLKPGARITIGSATIEIRAALEHRAGQARRRHRLRAARAGQRRRAARDRPARSPAAWCAGTTGCGCRRHATARCSAVDRGGSAQLPDAGWEIRTRTNATPALERNVERFTQFLTLVGLTALLVGGVGVANAVKSHI